jgi:hypothetical protein
MVREKYSFEGRIITYRMKLTLPMEWVDLSDVDEAFSTPCIF